MTDPPGREPATPDEPTSPSGDAEQRLPARRPEPEPPSVERFSSPPSTRSFALTPERAARIVRQSADARFIAFLAVVFVALFVALYYFYELGFPGGLTQSRLSAEADAQQVTAVERGYNLYQANCARCHGVNGEGGIGPTLNRQDKLFQHLNAAYIQTMLTVGGRYACGDANSVMPVWSDQGNPPGPLNYKQIQDVIAFIRSSKDDTFVVRDPSLFEPVIDPATGKEKTFTGWVDPAYSPDPGATPFPACWKDEFTAASSPSPAASPAASPSAAASPSPSPSPSAAASASPEASASASSSPAASPASPSASPAASPAASPSPSASAGTP